MACACYRYSLHAALQRFLCYFSTRLCFIRYYPLLLPCGYYRASIMGLGYLPVFSKCLTPFSFSCGCISFFLSGVLLVCLLLCSYPQFSGGFPSSPFGLLPILWFTQVCSHCGSFSCASSSAFAALLPGGVLWLPLRFRIPSLFLPPFNVRRLPVAHIQLPL